MAPPTLPDEAAAALRRFRNFYDELYTVKRLLRDDNRAGLLGRSAADGNAANIDDLEVLLAVRRRLRNAIVAQGFGGTVSDLAPAGVDPGYVWTAVADAMLMHDPKWPGQQGWADKPLEVELYGTRNAGDRIFEAVEQLVRRRTEPDPDGTAMTILLAFELGYRGHYRGTDDHGEIERLKASLINLVFRGSSGLSDDFDGWLTAGAAEALAGRSPARLQSIRPWGWAMASVAIGYLLLSWLIWWTQVHYIVDTATHAISSLSDKG
jgi:type VI secretion system protein ImpK